MKMNVLIVDNCKFRRKKLIFLLNRYCSEINVVDQANSTQEAHEKIEKHDPHVVVIGIQIQGKSGLQCCDNLGFINYNRIIPDVHNWFAVEIIQNEELRYLSEPNFCQKPQVTIPKAEGRLTNEKGGKNINSRKLIIRGERSIDILNKTEIVCCQASDDYTMIYSSSGREVTVSKPLKYYEQLLSQDGFYRVHNSHLVNINHITRYDRLSKSFILSNQNVIPVSVRRRAMVEEILQKL